MSDINHAKAIKTLSALAEGVDPETGELLAKDHVFNQPNVIRSLFAAIESLNANRRRQHRRQALPARAGNPWTDEESEKVRKEFQAGKSTKEISQDHQRTKGAIESQLVKIVLLQDVN